MASGYLQQSGTPNLHDSLAEHQGTHNFGKITLTTHTEMGHSTDRPSIMPTSGVRWSHLELKLEGTATNQTDRTCQVFFTWDSAGDDICAGPSSVVNMVTGRADTDAYMCGIDLDMVPSLPADGAANTVYCWVQTAFFITDPAVVLRARLHWYELSKG